LLAAGGGGITGAVDGLKSTGTGAAGCSGLASSMVSGLSWASPTLAATSPV